MARPFQIRDLRAYPSVTDEPKRAWSPAQQADAANATTDAPCSQSSSYLERHGTVKIQPEEYQELADQHPRARLIYVDDDDGDLITVGSALELIQRLEEPVDGSTTQPPGNHRKEPMHIFDIRRSRSVVNLWKKYEYEPSVSPVIRRLSPRPVYDSDLGDSRCDASFQSDTISQSTERSAVSSGAMDGSESLLSAFEAEMAKMLNTSESVPETAEAFPETPATAQAESERSTHPVDVLAHAVGQLMDGAQMIRSEMISKLPELEEQLQHVQRAVPEQIGATLQTAITTLESRVGDLTTLLNNTAIAERLSRDRNVSSGETSPAQTAIEGLHAVASELGDVGRTLFAAFEAEFGRSATVIGTQPTSEAASDPQISVAAEDVQTTTGDSQDQESPIPPKNVIENSTQDDTTGVEGGEGETGNIASAATHCLPQSNGTIANDNLGLRAADQGTDPQTLSPPARTSHNDLYYPNPFHCPTPPLLQPNAPSISQVTRPSLDNSSSFPPQMPRHETVRHSIFASMRNFQSPPPPPSSRHGVLGTQLRGDERNAPAAPAEHWRRSAVGGSSAALASGPDAESHVPPQPIVGNRTLFIGNVGYKVTERMIRDVFNSKGFLVDVDLPLDSETGQHAGFGYLIFASPHAAKAALEALQGSHIDGHSINLEYSEAPAVEASTMQRNPLVAPVSELSAHRPLDSNISDVEREGSTTILDGCGEDAVSLRDYPALEPAGSQADTAENSNSPHTGPSLPSLSGEGAISRFPPVSQLEAQMWADRRRPSSSAAPVGSRVADTLSRQERQNNLGGVGGNSGQARTSNARPPHVPGAFPDDPQGMGNPQHSTNARPLTVDVPHHLGRSNTAISENHAARLFSPVDPSYNNTDLPQSTRGLRRRATERQGLRYHAYHGQQRQRRWRGSETESARQPDNQQTLFAGYRSMVDSLTDGDLECNHSRHGQDAAERSASDMSLNPSVRRRQIEACVDTLMDLGYGLAVDGGRARLTVYAAAADGKLLDAIEMIEEERKVYDQFGRAT